MVIPTHKFIYQLVQVEVSYVLDVLLRLLLVMLLLLRL